MSHGPSLVSLEDVPTIVSAPPFRLHVRGRILLWLLVAVGVLAFLDGLTGGAEQQKRAWISLHINFVYWLCLSAAATAFSAVFQICNAQWARSVRRLFESGSRFFLYSVIPMAVLYCGHKKLFSWATHPVEAKEFWLSSVFLYSRDFLGLLLLIYLSRKVVFLSVRRDIGAIRKGLTGVKGDSLARWNDSSYDSYMVGWKDDPKAEIRKINDTLGRLSPVVIAIYGLVMSFFAFDQIMSVDPHWYSTLFGAFIFMGAGYLALAWVSIGVGMAREMHPIFRAKVDRRTLHDVGKLLFGFGIFWAYLFWSHYLTIWYANMPEETGWLITRAREPIWHGLSWLILGSCFIVPFFLGLSRDVKQIPSLLCGTGAIVACGIWLQDYVLFVPTLYPHEIPLGMIDVFITLGFMGAFLLSAVSFLSRVPLIPFGDLYVSE